MKKICDNKSFSALAGRMEAGFTLLETSVYAAILVMVMIMIASFMLWMMRTDSRIKGMNGNFEELSRTMRFLEAEIKDARGFYEPTTGPSQLTLITAKYADSSEDYVYADLFLCGQRLCYKIDGGAPEAITSEKVNLTALNFQLIATSTSPSVRIGIGMEYAPTAGRTGYESVSAATTTITTRGY